MPGGSIGDGGPATSAVLADAHSIAVDASGNLYIADSADNRIRKVSDGIITTVAGNGNAGFSGDNGPATGAELNGPDYVAVDSAGNLYIADFGNNRIRKVANGVLTTLTQLRQPVSVAVDSGGNLFVDGYDISGVNNGIWKLANGATTMLTGGGPSFGDNSPGTVAQLNHSLGIALDPAGRLFIGDAGDNRVRLLTPGTPPAITTGGIVPVYSSVSVIQPGSWVSIYGSDLASGTAVWNGDFPVSLGGTSVTIDNKPAYLWVVSPTQINLQVPDDTVAGLVSVAVTTASGTATSTVTLAEYGPSFSLLGDGKHVAGEIATPNGTGAYAGGSYDLAGPSNTFSYNTRPVKAGETLTLYGVGFGPTNPHVSAGQVFSGTAPTSTPVTVTIGGVNANVSFAGITEAGLYQLDLTVPANTGSGDQPVQAAINGVQTPVGPVVAVQ